MESIHGDMSSLVIDKKKKKKKILLDDTESMVSPKKQKLMPESDKEEEFKFPAGKDFESKKKDKKKKSTKLIFDDTGSIVTPKKQKLMSDSDEEDEEFKFPDEKDFELKNKLVKLQSTVGNDQRFALDNRFIEDEDHEKKEEEENFEDEFSEERKKQLEILGDVLGKPIFSGKKKPNDRSQEFKSAGKMIRYDPTDETHLEYEIQPQKAEKIKKKKKKEPEKLQESEPIPVSNEVFFSVSDKLTNALEEGEQFSLFKTLGKDATEPSTEKPEIPYEAKESRFGFNFGSNKAFKYDSSGDEEQETNFPDKKGNKKSKSEREGFSNSNENSDRFFFIVDDPRFQECEEFFGKPSERSEDLKTLRPKLKQTIRKRIRTNLKKNSVLHKKKLRRQKF